MPTRSLTSRLAFAFAAVLATILAGAPGSAQTQERGVVADQPNIVFVLTDDQTLESFTPEVMPQTFSRIVNPGTRFTDAVAAPPLCCPYRAGFLTGQYPHNHGVFSNRPGYSTLRDPENTVGTWLQEAGYETALVGKYLNGFEDQGKTAVAAGWDEWYSVNFGSGFRDPAVNDNGTIVSEQGYLTDVLNDRAVEFVEDASAGQDPFFLWLTHISPHSTTGPGGVAGEHCSAKMPQPTDADWEDFTGPTFAQAIQSKPSYNEPGYGDKPRQIDPLTPEQEDFISRYWRCEITSLAAVDRGVGDLVDRLAGLGELNDTIVVYGSDNGFLHGEHRYPRGKGDIYREAMEVPLAARIPQSVLGEPAADSVGSTVTQLDLTATLMELSGADPCAAGFPCRRLDGRSFAPLMRGDSAKWWRQRAVLFELGKRCRLKVGVRTKRHTYVQRAPECDGQKDAELYNRIKDPFELRNLAKREKKAAGRLFRLTRDLRRCSGVRGRDPKAIGATFCR